MHPMILPGATLGMLGGGQLGRMFTSAARTLGYRVMVLDPDPLSPAGEIADVHLRADYHDAIPLNRYGLEEEIAEAVFFLCSERASYITGQVLAVDGGFDASGIGLPTLRRDGRNR